MSYLNVHKRSICSRYPYCEWRRIECTQVPEIPIVENISDTIESSLYNSKHYNSSTFRLPTASFSITSRNSSVRSGTISASTTIAKGASAAAASAVLAWFKNNQQFFAITLTVILDVASLIDTIIIIVKIRSSLAPTCAARLVPEPDCPSNSVWLERMIANYSPRLHWQQAREA